MVQNNLVPKDFEKVLQQLREEFGECPDCRNPLVPLRSFKFEGTNYCEVCYRHHVEVKHGLKEEVLSKEEFQQKNIVEVTT